MSLKRGPKPRWKVAHASTCPDCGKIRYITKKDAKDSTRRQGRQKSRYYKCGDFWHATSWSPAKTVAWYRERQR